MTSVSRICTEDGCTREIACRGYCDKHYRRRKKDGTLPERVKPEGCNAPDDCTRKHYALGYCFTHYRIERDLRGTKRVTEKCVIAGCDNFRGNRNLCRRHYGQAWSKGLTPQRLNELLGSNCEICGAKPETPCIDHDHTCCPGDRSCGECVRGLLCSNCNAGLGQFRDSQEALRGAVEYLDRYEVGIVTAVVV